MCGCNTGILLLVLNRMLLIRFLGSHRALYSVVVSKCASISFLVIILNAEIPKMTYRKIYHVLSADIRSLEIPYSHYY